MVVVKIIGGLGNQLFQYATARRLAEHRRTELVLDTQDFQRYYAHRYGLGVFPISGRVGTAAEVRSFLDRRQAGWLFRRLRKAPTVFREKSFAFDPDVLDLEADVYLDGYFQSERYFLDIRAILLQELEFPPIADERSAEIARAISGPGAISVHFRRGDYVSNADANAVHGTCGPDYYARAFEHILKHVQDPHLFVFSDDITWVRANAEFPCPTTFVSHNGPECNYEDLRLMSLCKHNIIANSSFSWWGAWLNRFPAKTVIAPSKWFASGGHDTSDLIPAEWIRL